MSKHNIDISSFTLAKGTQLTGDDFFEVRAMESITVAIVCDGVGSAIAGAEAAKRTANFLMQSLKKRPDSWSIEKSIRDFIGDINRVLYLESMEDYEREELVTTLTLVVIEGDRLYGANVGDSRIYLSRDDNFTQLSVDHSMDERGMESVLTSAIGLEESVEPYYFENNLQPKDEILLCSDGLYSELTNRELIEGIPLGASYLVKKASKLHDDKLPDDTTAVILKIKELDPRLKLKQSDLIIKKHYRADKVIDGYRLIEPLIQNNRTWLCENKGVKYVLKFAPFEAIDDPTLLDLYVKEAWNSKRLKAGFFPKAVIPKNRTHRYYVMSFIDGISLKEFTKKRPLSIDAGVDLAKFLLKMAQFLIRKDLVHGDIKPENIIVTKRGEKLVFKMVDFGSIVEVYSIVTRAGTPSYIAPERFGQSPINEQTEIYAIGVTLYEALTKKFPYGEIEPFQTPKFDKRVKHPSSINPKIPKWLESIILHSINPDSERRYSKYSEFYHNLENPKKVKPYFDSSASIIEKKPLLMCRIGFVGMLILNLYLLVG